MAIEALVLVFDKHSAGEVTSLVRYLCSMVEKAWGRGVHLERIFFGRLSGQAARVVCLLILKPQIWTHEG